ncbi:hypothetical protein BIW11_00647 [Tropilaelaps mercedesae]|uniref:Small ribosomal subunit protein uS10 domain-containing protein n=1 Tax=Tropilaelaps mercedesae TaxID=418985 RepID=A0A1V9XRP4_9ACAR|nr:hypothetical protein BIW11_00647 [Tropilaelaps mercedesae]
MFRATAQSLQAGVSLLSRRMLSNFEPPYLELLKPPLPVYEDRINIQLKGYDFVVLEQQARKVVKLAKLLNISVTEAFATPLQALEVSTFVPQSTVVDKTFKLNIYERNVQVELLSGVSIGLLLDLVQKNLAVGVSVSVHKHLPEHEEIRYVPDLELESLQQQLEEIKKESSKN